MPRLSSNRFLQDCKYLRLLWQSDPGTFAELSQTEQRWLHQFYQPAQDLSDVQRLAHRERITQKQSSLPQMAGRALSHLNALNSQLLPRRRRRPTKVKVPVGKHSVIVHPVLNPDPDPAKFAKAIIAMVNELTEEELTEIIRENRGQQGEKT